MSATRTLGVIALSLFVYTAGHAQEDKAEADHLAAIGALNELYVTAFNGQDELKLRTCFAKKGEFTLLTGDTIEGREVIGKAHADFFKSYPDAKVDGKQLRVRAISPHIYVASGTWSVKGGPYSYPKSGNWYTVISRASGKWGFESMRLMAIPAAAKSKVR